MKHEMTDEEYSKYLEDMQELAKFRRIKVNFPRIARSWFDDIAFWFGEGRRSPEMLVSWLSSCSFDSSKSSNYVCDHCPFPNIFGCPFGHEVDYSK
jgi:hypothetical protein